MIEVFVTLLLGFLNRVRGGLFGDEIRTVLPFYGTTLGRIVIGLGVGFSAFLLGGSVLLSSLLVPLTVLGFAIGPFAPFQFMDRTNDLFIMALRGLVLTGITSLAFGITGAYVTAGLWAVSGLLMGPIYLLSSRLPVIPYANYHKGTEHTNDTAEILFGIFMALQLIISI